MEIRSDLEEFLEKKRASFTGQFFEGQHLYPVVIELQVAAVRLDLRVAKLEVEISAAMQAGIHNLEGAEIDEAPQCAEGFFGP